MHRARGLCGKHYQRWKKYGDAEYTAKRYSPRTKGTLVERFASKILVTPYCWLWKDSPRPDGYGQLTFEGNQGKAHRTSYELFVGEIPEGMEIDHKCRNRICVNPHHLQAVTSSENKENSGMRSDNTSGHKGVWWNKKYSLWEVNVWAKGKKYYGGRFESKDIAGDAAIRLREEVQTNNLQDRLTPVQTAKAMKPNATPLKFGIGVLED